MKPTRIIIAAAALLATCVAAAPPGGCELPEDLRGMWENNTVAMYTHFTFTNTTFGPYKDATYTCHADLGNDTLLMRTPAGNATYRYACFEFVFVTSTTYLLRSLTTLAAAARRLPLVVDDDVTACDAAAAPSPADYVILVRKVARDDQLVSVACPPALRGQFSYALRRAGKRPSCTADSLLDVCADPRTMFFDYNRCPEKIGHSINGVLSCMAAWRGDDDDGSGYVFVRNVDPRGADDRWSHINCFSYRVDNATRGVRVQQSLACQPPRGTNASAAAAAKPPPLRLELTRLRDCPAGGPPRTPQVARVLLGLAALLVTLM